MYAGFPLPDSMLGREFPLLIEHTQNGIRWPVGSICFHPLDRRDMDLGIFRDVSALSPMQRPPGGLPRAVELHYHASERDILHQVP
jgi:hypothetical protein